ncbi:MULTISPECIES: DJ-1 family glyoxalase III [Clostridium]|uniref:DJ-1 family glyoxalase III n=1 Tax=Clostridium TaxID=1485 RepID=UPI00069EFCD7|nr:MULTISPECIES: DJ-1 family glyoxalase III [Clostridium]KOF56420.1 thiamine biosynthesis protein ThiJ [Clostridium sp. DMHC 10]MCD2345762.1 DJ-1/PfpI family protein [Clostridium guangxiense]
MSKVLLFLAEGFEEIEALTVVDVLRRAEIVCDTCSLNEENVIGAHGIKVFADKTIENINAKNYDAVVIPGGMPGAENLKNSDKVVRIVKDFNDEGKVVSAICAGPIVLGKAKVTDDKKVTSYPGYENELGKCNYLEDIAVMDDNIITSRGPATAIYFALKLVEKLKGIETVEKLKEGMLVNFLESKIKA